MELTKDEVGVLVKCAAEELAETIENSGVSLIRPEEIDRFIELLTELKKEDASGTTP